MLFEEVLEITALVLIGKIPPISRRGDVLALPPEIGAKMKRFSEEFNGYFHPVSPLPCKELPLKFPEHSPLMGDFRTI